MRKAFKVATVFTGVAACAAVFTPAAEAATTTIKPATSHRDCGAGGTTSMMLWFQPSAHHGPLCVGGANGKGWNHIGLDTTAAWCAGNNSGSMLLDGRSLWKFKAGQSGFWANSVSTTSVRITHYGGSDKCYPDAEP
jgi:hypothetical protein